MAGTKMPVRDRFRINLKRIMDEKGLSMSEVARRAKMHVPDVSNILSGKRSLTLETASRLADAVGVDESELFANLKIPVADT